ncbi:hypothetical protein RN001_000190 [Aquatica leii]|uniref:Uncharacterized protein n=1 Tax=Aquatica leii TaxID=1421715 RepID=A0AAN7SKD7_9COLE|nr:hypothetical protein RN001_000190 [Aquatica leii]
MTYEKEDIHMVINEPKILRRGFFDVPELVSYFCCCGIRYIRTNTNTRTDLVAAVFGIALSMGRSMLPSMLPGVEAGSRVLFLLLRYQVHQDEHEYTD